MKKAIEFETPSLPNFIRAKGTEANMLDRTTLDVADFTDEELEQIGKEWTEALIEHAKERRSNKS